MNVDRSQRIVATPIKFNNIMELRLVFSLFVLVSHSIQLGAFTRYDIWRKILSSEVAVQGFFILSGFLVLGSFSRMHDIRKFYLRRFLRVYPGYLVAVLFFLALALIQAAINHIPVNYSQLPRYLAANLVFLNFLQPGISGLFQTGAYHEINGALWTIKLEVMFYALVPVLYWAGSRHSFRITGAAMIALGLSWLHLLDFVSSTSGLILHPALVHQLPGQIHYFGIGVLMFDVYRSPGHKLSNASIVIATIVFLAIFGSHSIALQVLLLAMFIYGITQLPQIKSHLGESDLSYGIYLSHFPLIQMLICAGALTLSPPTFISLVLVLAVTYALASWHWVERPAANYARKVGK